MNGVSQVFLCIDTKAMNRPELHTQLLDEIIDYTQSAATQTADTRVKYPGQRAQESYQLSKVNGMQVSQEIWDQVVELIKT